MKKNKTLLLTNFVFAAVFILLLFTDRITKNLAAQHLMKADVPVINNILVLHYLENRGAAWGLFQNAFWMFYIITILVLIAMVYYYVRLPFTRHYWYMRCSILLIAAGAIGNFIDRAIWHYVVDFIYIQCINFPVFNVADCYVCIGAVLLIYGLLFYYKNDKIL